LSHQVFQELSNQEEDQLPVEQFFFNINIGVGQESTLSPILPALYLSSFLYILEKC